MRKFSITDKLVLISLSVSVMIIFTVASFSFYKAKQIVIDKTFDQLTSVRVIKSNLLKQFFKNCITELKSTKTSCIYKKILTEINEQEKRSYLRYLNDSILGNIHTFPDEVNKIKYTRISIYGDNNNIYFLKKYSEFKLVKDIYFEGINNNLLSNNSICIQDNKKSKCSFSNLLLSSKMYDNKNREGIIVFEISPKAIDRFMLEENSKNGLGTSGESYLVGKDLLMRSTSRFNEKSFMKTRVKTEAVIAALKGISGNKIIKDYRGVKVLSSYGEVKILNLTWVILAEIDYKEAMVPVYDIRNEIIFYSIFIFLIVLIVVIILSRKITIPVQKLNEAVCEIAKGNYQPVSLKISNDEIGELSENFKKMSAKISEQTEDLKNEKIKSLNLLIDGQEKERKRLSRELHDSLGQLLIALKLKYESSKNIETEEDELSVLFDKTIEETRRISNNLMPAALTEFGLFTTVRNMCNEISEISGINIKFDFSGNEKELSEKIKIWSFRIIQEGLTNILKHSKAENGKIKIHISDKILKIEIADDGIGFKLKENKTIQSNGLNNIKDRVSLLGGTLNIITTKNEACRLFVKLPL